MSRPWVQPLGRCGRRESPEQEATPTPMTLAAPDPAEWIAEEARRFVRDVWGLLQAHGGESFQLRKPRPYGTWRREFVADTGTAVTILPI